MPERVTRHRQAGEACYEAILAEYVILQVTCDHVMALPYTRKNWSSNQAMGFISEEVNVASTSACLEVLVGVLMLLKNSTTEEEVLRLREEYQMLFYGFKVAH